MLLDDPTAIANPFYRSSERLAAAYGVAVLTTMMITTILIGSIARHLWNWSKTKVTVALAPLLAVEVAFAAGNNLRYNDSLQEIVVFVSAIVEGRPPVHPAERERVIRPGLGFHQIELRYGFMDRTEVAHEEP